MKHAVRALILAALAGAFPCGPARAAWWERPHDKWYLKDDWKAAPVNRYTVTLALKSPAASGWTVAWGRRGLVLKINTVEVMRHVDRALVYDADLTPFISGEREVKLEFGPAQIVAEGEIIDDEGRRYPFASGCDWPTPAEPGAKLPPSPKRHKAGPSAGAYHSAHNGRLMRYNDEERGKTAISRTLARIQKLRDQSIFLLRRHRSVREILTFEEDTLCRRAERSAAGPVSEAEKILKKEAVPAQKAGRFKDAVAAAGRAGAILCAAELAIHAACEVEKVERSADHVEACAGLMGGAGAKVPVLDRDIQEIRDMMRAARREATFGDWGNVLKRATAAGELLAGLREGVAALWGSPIGGPDEFPEDRFGWLNVTRLMGNDPYSWEFSVFDPTCNRIDLTGTWSFRLDPPNEGGKLGWHKPGASLAGWRTILVPRAWERQGVRDENEFSPWDCPYELRDKRNENKPYNGYAWYRREVHVPASWRGRKVVLRVNSISNWSRIFFNGNMVGGPKSGGGAFTIPAGSIRFGGMNSIAINVYNHNNFGGITGGPVSLAVDDYLPERVQTPGPMSLVREFTVKTADGTERVTMFSSAMSPAVVVTSDRPVLRMWGWEAKGYSPPEAVTFVTDDGPRRVELGAAGTVTVVKGRELAESWLLLSRGAAAKSGGAFARSKAVLIVLEGRPAAVEWGRNSLGYGQLTFDTVGRALLLTLPESAREPSAEECRVWARRLRAVPVTCSELYRLDMERLRGEFHLKYGYFEIPDFTGEPAERTAPVPQLLSYAMKHKFPGISFTGVETTSYSSEQAPYRLVPGGETLSYSAPIVDKTKLLKGVGELFAKKTPQANMRGGLSEQRMVDDFVAWGFDHNRYAFHWGAKWDLPLQEYMGGPVSDDPALWARLDQLVKMHTDRGVQMMLCYFFNDDRPQKDSKGLMRNSTRYWRMHPETRKNVYELWRRIVERYKDYPEHLISYDFFNEPAYMYQDDWNRIIKDMTRIVRSIDRKHLIVIEAGDGWSQSSWFHWVKPTGDANTVYSFHHYGKHWGYHYDEYYPGYKSTPERLAGSILEVILFGIEHNVPMHCGEFGVSIISPGEDHLAWLNDYLALFERFGMGWNWWNWDGRNIYRTGLRAGEEISPNVPILRKWIDRKTPPAAAARR